METVSFAQDDNANAQTNSAPASNNNINSQNQVGSVDGTGQRPTTKLAGNPNATNLRRNNFLSTLSSYTYCITLYIVTPDCYNEFANGEGQLPDTGYYIIAQSGGITNSAEPRALTDDINSALGPNQAGLDFNIDDLNIDTILLAKDGKQTATVSTSCTFRITEPLGFTFLTRLSKASQQINKLSTLLQTLEPKERPNLYQQHYMIGIKFYGYDATGNVMKAIEIPESYGYVTNKNDPYALAERIFPVVFSKVSSKIDGRATVYNFEGTLLNLQAAYGSKRGFITGQASFEGATVGDVVGNFESTNKNSLIGWLNDNQAQLAKNEKIEKDKQQRYRVDWSGYPEIQSSPMVWDKTYDPATAAMSGAQNVQQANTKTAQQSQTTPVNKKSINFGANTAILSALDQIIVKSAYISDTLLKKNTAEIETTTQSDNTKFLKWYAINPKVEVIGRDKITADWVYDITYQIVPSEVPYIRSEYVESRSKYYGPVKEYNYFFTGQNKEVISYEMEYNNAFYTVTSPTTSPDNAGKRKTGTAPRHAGNDIISNRGNGSRNKADEVVQSVRANLYSVVDQAQATIKILGDPDFLMDTIGRGLPRSGETFSNFYGANGSINPYNGQIFCEIIFKVAEDYKSDGLLDVDPGQSIAFYPLEQQQIQKSSGLIYKVISVKSAFSRGRFEQTLELIMVPPSELIMPQNNKVDNTREFATTSVRDIDRKLEIDARDATVNTNYPNNSDTAKSDSAPPDRPTATSNPSQNAPSNRSPKQINTNTTQVVDDDAARLLARFPANKLAGDMRANQALVDPNTLLPIRNPSVLPNTNTAASTIPTRTGGRNGRLQ